MVRRLGRNWSHDYAERLVSNSTASEVFLITRYATFRKYDFRNPSGVYERVSPRPRASLEVSAGGSDSHDQCKKF